MPPIARFWSLDAAYPRRAADRWRNPRSPARNRRLLPEQADFRAWKGQMLSTYQAMEPVENGLASAGRTRDCASRPSPNAEGGVSYLYDDATQSFARSPPSSTR